MGDTVDLPIPKAGGSCPNQSPDIADNIAGDIRIVRTVDAYDGKARRGLHFALTFLSVPGRQMQDDTVE